MHDTLTIGVPLVAILAGILLNRAEVRELRAEMLRRFDSIDARFNTIDAELRFFHGVTGKLEGRVEALEKRER